MEQPILNWQAGTEIAEVGRLCRERDSMSQEELEEFLAALEQVREVNTASPEAARSFLEQSGYLNKDGSVADPYKSAQSTPED
jgi:hypothetical protein